MIYGLTVLELALVAAILTGFVFLVAGVIAMLWPRCTPSGDILEVELPWRIKVKSNIVGLGVVIAGGVLLFGAAWIASWTTPKFPLTGRVTLDDGRTVSGISIGLIPPEHSATTAANGTFKLDVPRPSGSGAISYQAVIYYLLS